MRVCVCACVHMCTRMCVSPKCGYSGTVHIYNIPTRHMDILFVTVCYISDGGWKFSGLLSANALLIDLGVATTRNSNITQIRIILTAYWKITLISGNHVIE